MSTQAKARHIAKRKPPYLQYAILVGVVLWAIAVSIAIVTIATQYGALYGAYTDLAEQNEILTQNYIEAGHKIETLQEQLAQYQSSVSEHTQNEAEEPAPSTSIPQEEEVSNDSETGDAPYTFSSAAERDLVERVVMAEAGNQCFEGQVAVAQCILTTADAKGATAAYVVSQKGQYASPYSGTVTQSIKDAVSAVFDSGQTAVSDPIRYFYSTAGGYVSKWHENSPNLEYVCAIEDHKFFKIKGT